MQPSRQRADRFRYDGYTVDPGRGEVRCTYSTGGHAFTERYVFEPGGNWDDPAVGAAVRILFLMAGVSYYKTTAAHVIDLGDTASSAEERAFLAQYYRHGLGEFAYRNGIDLGELSVVGPGATPSPPHRYVPIPRRPLIPFGGGIDSIVTASALSGGSDVALCIVHPPDDLFAAIEDAAAVTSLPIVRIAREIDPLVRRSDEFDFYNGHVPITAVITAAALVAAVLGGRDAVVMSNEWSASVPTLVHEGNEVNHQWSKGHRIRGGLRTAGCVGAGAGPFGLLLFAEPERALGGPGVRPPHRIPRGLPKLQPFLPSGWGRETQSLVWRLRQVLLHRSHPGSLHERHCPRSRIRRPRATAEPSTEGPLLGPARAGA
jgi:hypothetical protein